MPKLRVSTRELTRLQDGLSINEQPTNTNHNDSANTTHGRTLRTRHQTDTVRENAVNFGLLAGSSSSTTRRQAAQQGASNYYEGDSDSDTEMQGAEVKEEVVKKDVIVKPEVKTRRGGKGKAWGLSFEFIDIAGEGTEIDKEAWASWTSKISAYSIPYSLTHPSLHPYNMHSYTRFFTAKLTLFFQKVTKIRIINAPPNPRPAFPDSLKDIQMSVDDDTGGKTIVPTVAHWGDWHLLMHTVKEYAGGREVGFVKMVVPECVFPFSSFPYPKKKTQNTKQITESTKTKTKISKC